MKCKLCGYYLSAKDKFCKYCGGEYIEPKNSDLKKVCYDQHILENKAQTQEYIKKNYKGVEAKNWDSFTQFKLNKNNNIYYQPLLK